MVVSRDLVVQKIRIVFINIEPLLERGLIVEVHPDPDKAWSDGEQSLDFAEFDKMMASLKPYVALREQSMAAQTLETVG